MPSRSLRHEESCKLDVINLSVFTPCRYGTIAGGVLNVKAAYDCLTQMFGGGGGGGGGGTPTVDCKAQSVPVCVNTALGVCPCQVYCNQVWARVET